MPENTSSKDFVNRISNLYRTFFEGIDIKDYENKKLVQRIEFLENLKISNLDEESLEEFSKSILDARAISSITEGSPNKFKIGDRQKMGGKDTIEYYFLKKKDARVNDKLLEVLVQSWYKENGNRIEDFEEQDYDVEKEVDFRLIDSQELIECKRISGNKEGKTIRRLRDTKKKLRYCKKKFPDHTGHLIIDIGAHTSKLPTDYDEFSKQDFKDEEINEIKTFIQDEVEESEEELIDKVTICWLGAYINENTWYSLHKTVEKSFTENETSSYEGWTVRRETVMPGRSTLVISSDNKDIEHAKAGYDASVKGGQTFFNWSGPEPTGDKRND